MANLHYKTRDNTYPHGNPRVYFSCHPHDLNRYFDSLSEDILKKQNCTVWYADTDAARDEAFLADLKDMQLFVLPVTADLLDSQNDAMDIEFPFAIENRIPVLPIMMEKGLEKPFSKKCGDLQFLDKSTADATAISYGEKLKKHLDSVLIGDELAQKIRDAFDAYVFLSYRKKDRKHANELMRLIHKKDFCRDIAIWYDEFLTPGEDFNDSIKDALQKSGLFVLAVTPNVVNEQNYIMTTEYPMAREVGKPILPAELVPTDRKQLSENYKDIPDPTDAHDDAAWTDALLHSVQRMARKENDASPEHNFFIGLAYLSGIDVEVDHDRAISLIRGAAESGLMEAQLKMVDIYALGMGVKRDYHKACEWKEICNRTLWNEVDKNLRTLGYRRERINTPSRATREELEVGYQQSKHLKYFETSVKGEVKNWCEKQLELAEMYQNAGDFTAAEDVLAETIDLLSNHPDFDPADIYNHEIISGPNTASVDTTFFDLHTRLIECFVSEMKYSAAEKWQKELLLWTKEVKNIYKNGNLDVAQFIRDADLVQARLLYRQGKHEDAQKHLNAVINELIAFIKSPPAPSAEDMKASISENGMLHVSGGGFELGLDVYMHLYKYMDFLSDAFMLLAGSYLKSGMKKEAFDAFDEAVATNKAADSKAKISREVVGKLRMAETADDPDKAHQLLKEVANRLSYLDEKSLRTALLQREYYKVAGNLSTSRTDAAEQYKKALSYAETLARELKNVKNLYALALLHEKLYPTAASSEEAKEHLDAMRKAAYDLEDDPSANAQSTLGDIYLSICSLCKDTELLKKAYDIFENLQKRYPEEKSFSLKLEKIKEQL